MPPSGMSNVKPKHLNRSFVGAAFAQKKKAAIYRESWWLGLTPDAFYARAKQRAIELNQSSVTYEKAEQA